MLRKRFRLIEYKTVIRDSTNIWVDNAIKPITPHGFGWLLISATIIGTKYIYWWGRLNFRMKDGK